jgi:hypothetical protein
MVRPSASVVGAAMEGNPPALAAPGGGERGAAPPKEPAGLPCPRCESTDTKFCYYNNYNLGQPRHFCKGCRRYWTRGGALRNVPVGGGTRKPAPSRRKRAPTTSSSALLAAASPSPLAMSAPTAYAATVVRPYDLPPAMPSSLGLAASPMIDPDRHLLMLDADRRLLDLGGTFTSLLTPAPDVQFSAGFLAGGLPPVMPPPPASSAPSLLPPHAPVSQALPEGFIWGGMGWPHLSI